MWLLWFGPISCRQHPVAERSDETTAEAPTQPSEIGIGGLGYVEERPFLTREDDYYKPDPIVGHSHRPDARRVFDWSEHPQGEIVFRTNNLGFREDHDTDSRPAVGVDRILVTGDSHIDGVVWNHESYPNLLEDLLNGAGRSVEIINGGTGYYGPLNYRLQLDKFANLGLAGFVVTIYTANDFLEAGIVLEATGRPNERPEEYMPTFNSLPKRLRQVAGQHLNQTFYLNTFPHMQDATLDFVVGEIEAIQRRANDLDIPILIVLLPSKIDVEQDDLDLTAASDSLGLEREQLNLNRQMAERLESRLAELEIPTLDLLPLFEGQRGLYWEQDHHLSVEGHRRIADLISASGLPPFDRQGATTKE